IVSEMHAAVDRTAFERDGGREQESAWAGVAYPDSSVDDVSPTVYFFGAEDKIRGPVRDEPAVDRGGASKQYPAIVDPHAARYVRSLKEAKIAVVDDQTAGDGTGKNRSGGRTGITFRCRQCPISGNRQHQSSDPHKKPRELSHCSDLLFRFESP